MSNNSFRKSLNSGGHIGSDKLENILKIYPELNPVWLLQGEGEMLKEYGGTSNLCRVTSVSIDEESFIYKMYKEKDIEVGQLKEEIGVLKTRIQQLEADNESLRNQAGVDRVTDTFTNLPLVDYEEDCPPVERPSSSKHPLAGKA